MAVPRTRILRATVVQGGADAFVQGELTTGLFASETEGLMIRRLILQDVTNNAALGAVTSKDFAISRRSKTAVPDITDVDCIFRWRTVRDFLQVTAAGLLFSGREQRIWTYEYPDDALDRLVVEDPLFLDMDSDGTTVPNTINVRIECEIVKLSQIERLSLLNRNS